MNELTNLIVNEQNINILSDEIYNIKPISDTTQVSNCSLIIQYTQSSNTNMQTIFSAEDYDNKLHLHIYIDQNGLLCTTISSTDYDNDTYACSLYRPASVRIKYKQRYAKNTIGFVANNKNKVFKIFANGELIEFKSLINSPTDYKFLSTFNRLSLGATILEDAIMFPFEGIIHSAQMVGTVLSDDEMMNRTSVTEYGIKIFNNKQDLNSNYFRIPVLKTLSNGTVVASIDVRYGGTHDSKSNISIGFSKSLDSGETWSKPITPLYFEDYSAQKLNWPRYKYSTDNLLLVSPEPIAEEHRIDGSASFIDSSIIEDTSTGRIFLFALAFPYGIGSPNSLVGNGFKEINNKQYLKLRFKDEETYDYSIREDNFIYNDSTNQKTDYSINEKYEVLKNNEMLLVEQYSITFKDDKMLEQKNGTIVHMNIMYKDSLFKVFPTTYIVVTHSDDDGETWSDMKILNVKADDERVLGVCPGIGTQLTKGDKKGRLILPVYVVYGTCAIIYSDDNGKTWSRSNALVHGSETQIVEMPCGTLKMFERTPFGKIGVQTSYNNGDYWENPELIDHMISTDFGSQLSAILYDGLIDGKHAIMLSSPKSRISRVCGTIYIGLIDPENNDIIDWKYEYKIDGEGSDFSYSCLANLPNGNIGIFYETVLSSSSDYTVAKSSLHMKNGVIFEQYSIDDLTKKHN